MTFFHFANCVALAYVPFFIIYKCSGLAEYSAFWKCVQASVAYLVTQLVKMLLLATFFSDNPDSLHFDLVGEFLKCTVDSLDLVGMHLTMSQFPGKGQLKYMITGIGWSFAELVAKGFLPLWIGARGIEFDWKYMQMSFLANINLLQHIVTAMLVWLYARSDLSRVQLFFVFILLSVACYQTFIINLMNHIRFPHLFILLTRPLTTLVTGSGALQISSSLTIPKL